eukprot:TRINITY_DN2162_c0_g1_i4.p1 TRINITY_DN2162_c0_g1~~TRINITY_DN2162_c0_g1_i4.p1  ORF type:complete len:128 (-),score=7.13 TRINITY_DN2162_c0_g1_i4:70-453(-)
MGTRTGTRILRTTRKLYLSSRYVVGSYSAIVRMENGNVTRIDWNDGCQECNEDRCIDNVCGIDQDTCARNERLKSCDLKVYLGWIGTDLDGTYCRSAGDLPSNFRQFALRPVYEQSSFLDQNPNTFF